MEFESRRISLKKFLIILVVIIALCFVFGLLLGRSAHKCEEVPNQNNGPVEVDPPIEEPEEPIEQEPEEQENTAEKLDETKVYLLNTASCVKAKCTKNFNGSSVVYSTPDKEKNILGSITINETPVATDYKDWEEANIYYYNKTFILELFKTDTYRTTILYLYDNEGKDINKYQEIDKYHTDMVIESIKVKPSGIIVKGTRLYDNHIIKDANDKDVDLTLCDNYNLYQDELIKGDYFIEYKGNQVYEDIIRAKYYKLKDLDMECK